MTSLGAIAISDGDGRRITTPRSNSEQEAVGERSDYESGQDLLRSYAYLTPEQVARVLQLDVSTVYRKLRNHQLPGHKALGKWLVPTSELIDFMATPGIKGLASTPSPPLVGQPAARRGRLAKICVEGDGS